MTQCVDHIILSKCGCGHIILSKCGCGHIMLIDIAHQCS